jgi:hypothetical protein
MFKFTRYFLFIGAFLCVTGFAFNSYASLAYALFFTLASAATLAYEWFTE